MVNISSTLYRIRSEFVVGGREHFKEFRKVVSLADVVLQVLDARDPLGCRSNEVEEFIRQFSPRKRLVFLLNKTGTSFSNLQPSHVSFV